MNKNLHRVIFNAVRGQRMVVQETAVSTGKGRNGASEGRGEKQSPWVLSGLVAALALIGWLPVGHAQIVPNPLALPSQRPQTLVAPNGVPLVNITTPSAAGVSVNHYSQFDVGTPGAILNNSRTPVQSQLGGYIQGNPWLATGPARVIVNQVASSNPSYLNGYVEVAGQRAEVIIANPRGISVNGGGFINASRVTLTTGTPQYGLGGSLDGYVVNGGTVTVDGKGLDLSTTDYAAILSRALQVNAAIYANDLKVVTGANQISADHSQITAATANGPVPVYALDVSALGGMYAGHIVLVGSEAGLGVRNAGKIGASAGNLVVTSAGRLENTGTLEGQSVQLTSASDIDNRGGTIRQTSSASLALAAPTVSNTNGGQIGIEPVSGGSGTGSGSSGGATSGGSSDTSSGSSSSGGTSSSTGSSSGTTTSAPDPGFITASGSILNDGGKIYAGGPITLQTQNLVNNGGTLSVASMSLKQPGFSNQGGTINVTGAFTADLGTLDNTGGTLHAGSLNVSTSGDLINVDGTMTSDTDASLQVGGKVDNTRGTLSAQGRISGTVVGATDNTSGSIAANDSLQWSAASLSNDKGSVGSANGSTQLNVTGAITNGQGSLGAGTDLQIQAGSLSNAQGGSVRAEGSLQLSTSGAVTNDGAITAAGNATVNADSLSSGTSSAMGAGIKKDGTLATSGDLTVTASAALAANGTNLAAGNLGLQGSTVDVSQSSTGASNVRLTATSGNVDTSSAKVVTPGTLTVSANANTAQSLVNTGGTLNAGQLEISASNISNTAGGQLVQTGAAATTIAVSGTLDNSGSVIAANSQDLTLSGTSLLNAGGQVEHAGTGTLTLSGGSFNGAAGEITSNGALSVNLTGAFNQDGGTTSATAISIDAGSLSNNAGKLSTPGALTIQTAGKVANGNGGQILSTGDLSLQAAGLSNGGTIRSEHDMQVNTSGTFANDGGLSAAGNVGIQAGTLSSSGLVASGLSSDGKLLNAGDLTITASGSAKANGTNLAAGQLVARAADLDLSGSQTQAASIELTASTGSISTQQATVSTAGLLNVSANTTLTNDAGTLSAGQLAINAANIQNRADGHLLQTGTTATLIQASGTLDNSSGVIASNGQDLTLSAGSISNAAGQISHAGSGTLEINAQSYSGSGGQIGSNGALLARVAGSFDQNAGTTSAQSVDISAASLTNQGGKLISAGDLSATTSGLLDNSQAGQIVAGRSVSLTVGALDNASGSGGAVRAGSDLQVQATGAVNNAGQMSAAGNATINAGSVQSGTGSLLGAGIQQDGSLGAHGDLSVTAAGSLIAQGTNLAAGTLNFQGAGVDISHSQTSASNIALNGGTVGVNTQAATVTTTGTLALSTTGTLANDGGTLGGGQVTLQAGTISNTQGGRIVQTGSADTLIQATDTLDNTGGLISSQGTNVQVKATTVVNAAGQIQHAGTGTLTLSGNTLQGSGGQVVSNGALAGNFTGAVDQTSGVIAARQITLTAGSLDNSQGQILQSGTGATSIAVANALRNDGGTLASNGTTMIQAGSLSNTDGTIQAAGSSDLALTVTGSLANTGKGKIVAAQNLGVAASSLDNTGDLRAGANLTATVVGTAGNAGSMTAAGDVSVQAGALQSTGALAAGLKADGTLATTGDLQINATDALVAQGTNLAGAAMHLSGANVDLSGSTTTAQRIAIAGTAGDVATKGATVGTPGALTVHAAGALLNDSGTLSGDQVQLQANSLSNTAGGRIIQSGQTAQTIQVAAAGTLDNSGGLIASNATDLKLSGGSMRNVAGQIQHAGTGALSIQGSSFAGSQGSVLTNGALNANVTGAFDVSAGTTSAKQITLNAGSLDTSNGKLIQSGTQAMSVTVQGSVTNTGGTIASNGSIGLSAQTLSQQGGLLQGVGHVNVTTSGLLDNSQGGSILASGNASVQAGTLNNDKGTLTAAGAVTVAVSGAASNQQGTLASNNALNLTAGSYDNSGGLTASAKGDATLTTAGAMTNAGGTLQAAGTLAVSSSGLNNQSGQVLGNAIVLDAGTQALSNAQGVIASATTASVKSGALDNNSGLIQANGALTIDTHGQRLTNTNSAGRSAGQGGIVSGSTLTLSSGDLDNTGGYIAGKGTVSTSTNYFTNAGGKVLSEANVVMQATGSTLDNRGGQVQAAGDLTMGAGTVTNDGGLLRSNGTTALNAAEVSNVGTQGTDQGIEGSHVAITGVNLNNAQGAIRSNNDIAVTASGTVSNANGLMSAGTTLAVADPKAANPSSKTLTVVNTGGTLEARTGLSLNAARFSGDGTLSSQGDLSIDLTQDLTNNATLRANGDLRYATTGTLVNNGQLIAGGSLTVAGNYVANQAGAEMSGQNTHVQANQLDNWGLIDSNGETRIDAGTLNNVGSGRIYGNHVAIAAGTVNNGNQNGQAGTIASRGDLDIGAGTVNNTDGAYIFSAGNMRFGGGLDGSNHATGQGGVINNHSASIEALGNLSMNVGTVDNRDTHLVVGTRTETIHTAPIVTTTGLGGTATYWDQSDTTGNTATRWVYHRNADGSLSVVATNGWAIYDTYTDVTTPYAVSSAPASISSGGDMSVGGTLNNTDSRVTAGGTFSGSVNNQATTGTQTSHAHGITYAWGTGSTTVGPNLTFAFDNGTTSTTVNVGRPTFQTYANTTSGTAPGGASNAPSANGGTGGASGSAANATVPQESGQAVVVALATQNDGTKADTALQDDPKGVRLSATATSAVTPTQAQADALGNSGAASGQAQAVVSDLAVITPGTPVSGTTAQTSAAPAQADSAQAGAGTTKTSSSSSTATVVRTATPTVTLPQASLFGIQAGSGRYLVETDPRFANYRNWLSSDYLLNALGLDPNSTLKRLGDGFYEQMLIRQQVQQLTGYRFLDGYSNDEDEYTALMNAGATFAKSYGLTPGIALTAAQMAQLTSDIVWLVEQTVTLPDGTTQKVLVPQLYVRAQPGDIDGSGALLSADRTVIKNSGDLTNTGTIAGRALVSITADNVQNLGGRISGGDVSISAAKDINVIGGTVDAKDAMVLKAGNDINVVTTTQSTNNGIAQRTNVDRVAGLYVSNPDGVLLASAGNDVNVLGGIISSAGSVGVGAANNLRVGTVSESFSTSISATGKGYAAAATTSSSTEVGSVIQGQNNVQLSAGQDLSIRASGIGAGEALVASAGRNLTVEAGQATSSTSSLLHTESKSLVKKSSADVADVNNTKEVLQSAIAGGTVSLVAGQDVNLQAAKVFSQEATTVSAGRDVNITTAERTEQNLHASQSRSSGTAFGQALAGAMFSSDATAIAAAGNKKSASQTSAESTTEAVGTSISAGSLMVASGRNTTINGSTLLADGDITVVAGKDLTIQSAQNTSSTQTSNSSSASGMVGKWTNPTIGNVKSFGAENSNSTTQAPSQVVSLGGDVTLVAGNNYQQTASQVMAAGQNGTLAGGDVNILAKNVRIEEAYNTEQSFSVQRNSSTLVGGSANVSFAGVGVSTDGNKVSATGPLSALQAMGETDNKRAQALGALTTAMGAKQMADAATSPNPSGSLNYGVSVNVSRNTSQSTSATNSSTAVGSSVVGAGNVNIVATGGGKDSDILVSGSTVAAGNTVNLSADGDIALQASKDTSVSVGQSKGSGESVGVTYGVGAQTGLSIQLGVSSSKGSDNQNDTRYNASQVSAGNAVNIQSGGDLTLNGAVVDANRIKADVGGNLTINTPQDVSVGNSKQSSSGLNVSLCIPPICYGAVATVSANVAGAKANGVTISPNTQSGLKAGDGGFDVSVKGDTTLVGGVIESTQAAIDKGRNSFETGGTLTIRDLQNVSQSSGSSYAANGSLSLGQNIDPNASQQEQERQRQSSQPGVKPGGAGVGSTSSSTQSVTKAGISGIAGDQSVRTGDNSTTGTLVKDWNTQNIIKDVQAQATIMSTATGYVVQLAPAAVEWLAATLFGPSSAQPQTPAERYAATQNDFEHALEDPTLSPEQVDALRAYQGVYERFYRAYQQQFDTAPQGADDAFTNTQFALTLPSAGAGGAAAGAAAAAGGGEPLRDPDTGEIVGSPPKLPSGILQSALPVLPPSVQAIIWAVDALVISATQSSSSSNGGASNESNTVGADTYGTPPNGAAPPPDDNRDDTVSSGQEARSLVRSRAQPFGKNGNAFNVSSEQELLSLYNDLTKNSETVSASGYNGVMRILPDGTRVGLRNVSTSNLGKTLDVFPSRGAAFKVHIAP